MIAKSWQYGKKYYFFMVTISVLFLVFDRNILRSVEKQHFKNFFAALLGWNHPHFLSTHKHYEML